jgi:DNA-binding response OmpR family regulator
VFSDDTKLIQRMAPMLRKVLIVDPVASSARMLGDLMRNTAQAQIWTAPTTARGLVMASQVDPQVIFVELSGQDVDGVDFARQLRRGHLNCRQAPLIMVTAAATAAAIVAARDAGVHEFLRKPYTARDLLRRLEAVTLRPRDWVEAVDYIGPDRRRFNSGDYSGPLKRRSDAKATPDAARIQQALKIIKSALLAVEKDPAQVLRAMQAQAVELIRAASATSNDTLARAALDFQTYLVTVAETGIMIPGDAVRYAGPLIAMLPKDEPARGAPLAKAG